MLGHRDSPFDVAIVGGGINGCGIARDCAMRGLEVAVFEKGDFASGATWASSGMIHGGLRYISKDPDVTRLSCLDSGYIQKIARHLIFRVPFVMPFRERDKWAKLLIELADVYFKTYDRYAPLKGGKRHCRLTADECRALEPGLAPDVLGAVTTDEWGIDTARLTAINALSAQAHGAKLHTYHEVVRLLRDDDGRVAGLRVRDRLAGATRDVFARVVMNAAGPWGERFATGQNVDGLKLRPAKGIHLVFAGRITNYAIVSQAIDGRQIFLCPHQNTSFLGTTDDDYYGDLDDIPTTHDEVEYLVQGMETTFPSIRRYKVMDTMAGCRPTLYRYGPNEDDLTREHRVFDHRLDGAEGFLSIAGGKLASYRLMSEDATDRIVEKLGMSIADKPCRTHSEVLPGGEEHDIGVQPFVELGLSPYAASRIIYRHGSDSGGVLDLLRQRPEWARKVDVSEPVTEAELRYVIRNEEVRTLDDCRRRTRLGAGPDAGIRTALLAAQVFAEERGHSVDEVVDIALHYQAKVFERRVGALFSDQLAHHELTEAMLRAAGLAWRQRSYHVVEGRHVSAAGEPAGASRSES